MIHVFERPLLPGWVYPCTVRDICQQLLRLPAEDLEGLWAVGLVPATRKNCGSYAYHRGDKRSVIHICSEPESLEFKVYANGINRFAVEIAYGMRVARRGNRWYCKWQAQDLRSYIIEQVLLHEVGHHIQYWQGEHKTRLSEPVREQFADAYAYRQRRRLGQLPDVSPFAETVQYYRKHGVHFHQSWKHRAPIRAPLWIRCGRTNRGVIARCSR
jgi:hypothetical protein